MGLDMKERKSVTVRFRYKNQKISRIGYIRNTKSVELTARAVKIKKRHYLIQSNWVKIKKLPDYTVFLSSLINRRRFTIIDIMLEKKVALVQPFLYF